MQPLQTRQRETAPPRFLEQRASDEDHKYEGAQVGQHGQRGERLERLQGPGPDDYRGEHHDQREPYEGEQVPHKPDPPQHDPTQQAAYARPAFGGRGHDEPGQARSQQTGDAQHAKYRRSYVQDSVIGEHRG
jgi:hypothetical protein